MRVTSGFVYLYEDSQDYLMIFNRSANEFGQAYKMDFGGSSFNQTTSIKAFDI